MTDADAHRAAHQTHPRWELGYHLMPPTGWLNDPNGLCQFRGTYHVFFQYSPNWPTSDEKHWQHFTSTDLLHWSDEGIVLSPDTPEDRDGAYSGSAWVERGAASDGGDLMRVYYTGNVVYPGDFDHVHTGREANELEVTSEDGLAFSEKSVLLRNADYPASCPLHVRDPKVWEQGGCAYMLLGAREKGDVGKCLLFESTDGDSWSLHSEIHPNCRLGYMWECPNIAQVDGRDFLAVCPQGIRSEERRFWNLWQAGYFPLDGSILSTTEVDAESFNEWDAGYDFYAPQVFVDDSGRTLLIGWMGTFDRGYTSEPDGLGWCHCLTVPRELTASEDGLLRQMPVAELEQLRGPEMRLGVGTPCRLAEHRADIELAGVYPAGGSLSLDDTLVLTFSGNEMRVAFTDDAVACGRPNRVVPLSGGNGLRDLRVLVDSSAVEVYANGGETVFSTRWFPREDCLSVRSDLSAKTARVWPMEDALAATYR